MRKLILVAILHLLLVGCNPSENEDNLNLEGRTYVITNWIIDRPVDLNEDGIFSTDLVQEKNCFWNLEFTMGDRIPNPLSGSVFGRVVFDENDNPIQTTQCGHGDGAGLVYEIKDNEIDFEWNNAIIFSGILSENDTKITLLVPNDQLFRDEFLYEDGTIGYYEGEVIAVYELQ